jgi:hypothetical protein
VDTLVIVGGGELCNTLSTDRRKMEPLTTNEKNELWPVRTFRISDELYKLMRTEKESLGVTWEEYFNRSYIDGGR